MKPPKIKTTIGRQSDSAEAKRQQQDRRRETLFKKAYEYSIGCDAEVHLVIASSAWASSIMAISWWCLGERVERHRAQRPHGNARTHEMRGQTQKSRAHPKSSGHSQVASQRWGRLLRTQLRRPLSHSVGFRNNLCITTILLVHHEP